MDRIDTTQIELPQGMGTNILNIKYAPVWKRSEVKLIIINEISEVSSIHLHQIHTRIVEIFECDTDQPFAGILILVCWDVYQLLLVNGGNLLSYNL